MAEQDLILKMAEQLGSVVEKARETFVDLLEEHSRDNTIGTGSLSESDKRSIERLFSEVVYGHVVAEEAAILSFLVYEELRNDAILDRSVPALIDQFEDRTGEVSESVNRKTSGLAGIAKDVIGTGAADSEVVKNLLQDIADNSQTRPLRATYDAVTLGLLGQ